MIIYCRNTISDVKHQSIVHLHVLFIWRSSVGVKPKFFVFFFRKIRSLLNNNYNSYRYTILYCKAQLTCHNVHKQNSLSRQSKIKPHQLLKLIRKYIHVGIACTSWLVCIETVHEQQTSQTTLLLSHQERNQGLYYTASITPSSGVQRFASTRVEHFRPGCLALQVHPPAWLVP